MMTTNEGFRETERCLMQEAQPSACLRVLAGQAWPRIPAMQALLDEQTTAQSPVHHPEGSVWEHTLLVVDEAAKKKQYSADARAFMWAALLHDIGKPATTRVRKGRITAYDHDKVGAEMAAALLTALGADAAFAKKTAALVRYHMQLLYLEKNLPFQDLSGMKRQTDWMDIALLGYCDRVGRLGADADAARAAVCRFLQRCGADARLPW
ncbi:MAG: HDIG domain-containing protein [Oscillospiraceae bacterium]|nr:HDIG domain-containing protein [Oscillospiraceae bacterium]